MGSSSVLVRRKKGVGEISSTEADDASAGLRIVIVEVDDEYSNKIVVRSGLKALTNKPFIISSSLNNNNNYYCYYSTSAPSSLSLITSKDDGGFNCFLKSCHLCRKPLSPHKDVYMYRGDQGFCSIECRSRQIMLDEIKVKEDEKRGRRLKYAAAAAAPNPTICIDCVGGETRRLLRDLRKQHQYLRNNHKYNKPPNN